MFRVTLYLNNDPAQGQEFRARTREALAAKVRDYIAKTEPDFCLEFTPEGTPAYGINYTESYRDHEFLDADGETENFDRDSVAQATERIMVVLPLFIDS